MPSPRAYSADDHRDFFRGPSLAALEGDDEPTTLFRWIQSKATSVDSVAVRLENSLSLISLLSSRKVANAVRADAAVHAAILDLLLTAVHERGSAFLQLSLVIVVIVYITQHRGAVLRELKLSYWDATQGHRRRTRG